ncbi:MAG: alpha/beta hydrolase [Nitrosomonadales bacterium]|nr:alpha/beta hydrolase [Nitrosomonadales bacterium]
MTNSPSRDNNIKLSGSEHLEQADYLSIDREQLYFVLHPTILPLRGRVLLAGPFASERPHRYIPWVGWARHLANNGFEVMRFDYRGVGESTGRFEDFGFQSWSDDISHCANWLHSRSPAVPLIIHGLGMGALLGDRLFAQGVGDILLAWLPPKSAREMLYEQLKLKLSNNYSLPSSEHKTRDQYIACLESGATLEVEGHNWTPGLWAEAAEFVFGISEPTTSTGCERPRCVAELDALTAHSFGGVGPNPLRKPGGGQPMRLVNPDLSASFNATSVWLEETLAKAEVS